MNAPLFSSITLFTELLVTVAVLTVFWRSYLTSKFPTGLAFGTLGYEIVFNISYMLYSSMRNETHTGPMTWKIELAIFHGILSLIMFVSLIVFFLSAYRAYKNKTNYFAVHSWMTGTFILFWLLSVGSGTAMYIVEYVLK